MAIRAEVEQTGAPGAMNHVRLPSPYSLYELLQRLVSTFPGDPSELSLLQSELRALLDRLAAFNRDELEAVQLAGAFLNAPLEATLDRGAARGRLTRRDLRELRPVIRSLTCIVDRTALPARFGRLPAEQLVLRYERLNLANLVRRASAAFAALATERNVTSATNAPETLWAELDADKFELVLLNLLFNAFKYTPVGGRVDCTLCEVGGDQVLLRMCDSGRGIARSQVDAIFDRARQIDRGVSLRVQGVGLSLGTARDFVALHGGTLELDAHAATGAAFELRLPRRAPRGTQLHARRRTSSHVAAEVADAAARELRTEAALQIRERPSDDRRPLVLLLEASRSLQRVMVESLEPEYATVSAFSRNEAMRCARELKPDLIVADRTLLEDGEAPEVVLARWSERGETPILTLAERGDPNDAVRLLECGAQDLVYKPFLVSELRARVRNLVVAKRTRDLLGEAVGQRDTDLVRLAGTVTRHQRELARAVEDLQHARRAAEDANQIKRNFLRIMTHELKTPITAMQLHMRLLERDPDVTMSAKVQDGLDRISRASRRLVHLIDTVLEWARVESGRCELEMEMLDLPSMVAAVVAELEAHAKQKAIAIETRTLPAYLPPATGDRRLVQLVIINLLTRAVQVTTRGRVEVTIGHSEPSRHWIEVKDGSPSIPPEQRAAIFDPLRSAKGLQEYSGAGSGLGLHVVRDIARAFDGDVTLMPGEGSGNTFVLTLAAVPPERTTARMLQPLAREPAIKS